MHRQLNAGPDLIKLFSLKADRVSNGPSRRKGHRDIDAIRLGPFLRTKALR